MSNSQQKIFDERKEKHAYTAILTRDIKTYCPKCNALVNGFTEKARPKPDDLTVCIYCVTVAIFDKKLMLRVATPEEMESGGENLKGIIGMVKSVLANKRLDRSLWS